jgi:hypothetical protein
MTKFKMFRVKVNMDFCFVYMDNDNNIALMVHDSHRTTFENCNSINPDVIEDTIKTIRTTLVSARPFCG